MPKVSQTLAILSALVLISIGLAVAFLALWPRPASLILAGIALLCDFGALLVPSRAAGREYALKAQKAIFLVAGCCGVVFLGLTWKYRTAAPAFSLASLIAAALLGFGALATFFILRSTQTRID